MEILADATNVIAEGEVLQLLNVHDPDVTEARYMQVIHYKTARLFEASAQLAAVMSGCTRSRRRCVLLMVVIWARRSSWPMIFLDYAGDTAVLKKRGRRFARG